MPLYEYRCLKCDETFEVRQKFSDEPVATHAKCGGEGKRMLSAPQLHFKGSGFYITDYGKGGSGAIKPATPGTSRGSVHFHQERLTLPGAEIVDPGVEFLTSMGKL
jgi:putative FmdB family regulatory protein